MNARSTRLTRLTAAGTAAAAALLLLVRVGPAQVQGAGPAQGFGGEESASAPAAGRIPISSLPFTINQCGSYVLTSCLTGGAGQAGVTINADDVTLDLNGFTLIGVPGSLEGVRGNGERAVVVNGSVVEWGDDGIELTGVGARIENVAALDNGGAGIVCRDRSIVRACIARANGREGFFIGNDGLGVIPPSHARCPLTSHWATVRRNFQSPTYLSPY